MAPGMPMNVMAEATSHDMITVSWESPADDGGSAVTGYVLQSKTGTMDFMTIAASSAEIWWNTLDCQMMNAEIPDDATPAPPMDDTDMTSPYCAMYAGLSAEATTVVDRVRRRVRHDFGHQPLRHGPHGRDHVLLPSLRHELRRQG